MVYSWYIFVSIDAGAQVAIILLACRPCVVNVDYWNKLCTLGRAPRIKDVTPQKYSRIFIIKIIIYFGYN